MFSSTYSTVRHIQRYVKRKMQKKWRLFQATDFQSLMYPCFTFCRIIGIFPYKINASIFEISTPHYIISTIIVCICCGFDVLFIYDVIISKIDFGDITKNLEAVSYNMFCGFIVIVTHVLSGPRMRLLQTILEISSKLSSESYQKLSRFIYIKDTLGFIFVIVETSTYIVRKTKGELNYLIILIIVFEMYFYVLIFQLNMLYVSCVCVLKACFKSINDNLAHMQIFMTNDIKPCDRGFVRHVQRNQFLLTELKILKKWHLTISDAVKTLNVIFSLQLLATIVMSFCNITFQVYFNIVRWQDGILITFDIYFVIALLTAIGYYVINVTVLVWACETGKNQAQEISTTVHDILNSTNNEQIKYELQLFSLQILHRENKFSAKGLTVDATLLATMVGTITTYLLILVQFLNSAHSCDRKTGTSVTQSTRSINIIKKDI